MFVFELAMRFSFQNPEVFSNIYGNFTHDLDQYAYYGKFSLIA